MKKQILPIEHVVKCRAKDLVIRIADWTRDRSEPAFDVEIYIKGVYNFDESKTFSTKSSNHTKQQARTLAVVFASQQIAKLL